MNQIIIPVRSEAVKGLMSAPCHGGDVAGGEEGGFGMAEGLNSEGVREKGEEESVGSCLGERNRWLTGVGLREKRVGVE